MPRKSLSMSSACCFSFLEAKEAVEVIEASDVVMSAEVIGAAEVFRITQILKINDILARITLFESFEKKNFLNTLLEF